MIKLHKIMKIKNISHFKLGFLYLCLEKSYISVKLLRFL